MDKVKGLIEAASAIYKAGGPADVPVRMVALRCLDLLADGAVERDLTICGGKSYSVWRGSTTLSRPVLKGAMLTKEDFVDQWFSLLASANGSSSQYEMSSRDANAVVYTAISSVSVAFDLWRASSRKTPGTYFEMLVGSLLQRLLPGYERLKHVILKGQSENVSTDILFSRRGVPGGLVIPVKITTRERIVQAFAHQRILDSYFGTGVYKSALICVSEMQRDEDANANEICVPGAIRLYQEHLAKLSAIYYLDPPSRYLKPDVTDVVPVRSFGDLLVADLPGLIAGKSFR